MLLNTKLGRTLCTKLLCICVQSAQQVGVSQIQPTAERWHERAFFWCARNILYLLFFFGDGGLAIFQAGLKLLGSRDPTVSASQAAELTGMSQLCPILILVLTQMYTYSQSYTLRIIDFIVCILYFSKKPKC